MPIIRNNLYDLLQQFDHPDPATSTGLRNSSVVAPQALLMMNSDLTEKAALAFAQRLLQVPEKTMRLQTAYQLAYARKAADADLNRAENFLVAMEAAFSSSQQDTRYQELQAWKLFCQALLMGNEFIYLR